MLLHSRLAGWLPMLCAWLATGAFQGARADTAGETGIGSTLYPRGGMAVVQTFADYKRFDYATCVIAVPDGSKAWVGFHASSPNLLAEVDLASMRHTGVIPLSSSGVRDAAIHPAGTHGYFVYDFSLNRANLEARAEDFVMAAARDERFYSVAVNPAGTYAYLTLDRNTTQGQVMRLNLATMARSGTLSLPGLGFPRQLVVDPAGTFLYLIAYGSGVPYVVKVRASNMTYVAKVAAPLASDLMVSPQGDYLYATQRDRITRVSLTDFATSSTLVLPQALGSVGVLSPDALGTQAMAATSNGSVIVVDLSAFTLVTQLTAVSHLRGGNQPAFSVPLPDDRILLLSNSNPSVVEQVGFDLTRSGPLFFEGGEYSFAGLLPEYDGRFATLLASASFPNLLKVDLARFKRVRSTLLTTEQYAFSAASTDGRYGYAGMNGVGSGYTSVPVIKFDLQTLRESARHTLPARRIDSVAYNSFNHAVYTAYGASGLTPGVIGRIDVSTFATFTNLVSLNQLYDTAIQLVANTTADEIFYARYPNPTVQKKGAEYISSPQFPGTPTSVLRNPQTGRIYSTGPNGDATSIYELHQDNLQTVRQSNVYQQDAPVQGTAQGALDPQCRFALYPTLGFELLKQRLNDFDYIDRLPIASGTTEVDINLEGTEAYLTGQNALRKVALTPRGRMEGTRFRLTTVAQVDAVNFHSHAAVGPRQRELLPLGDGLSYLKAGFIDRVHNRAWFGTQDAPGRIIQFDCATRDVVSTSVLRTGENDLTCGFADASGTYGYFATGTVPGKIIKIRLADGARFAVLTLAADENFPSAVVLDSNGTFAYFATNTSPMRIVKVRMSNFTRVGALTMEAGEDFLSGLAINPQNTYLYAACRPFNAKIVKIRLSDFTRTAVLPLTSQFIYGLAMDTTGSFLYAAGSFFSFNGGIPGVIERVRLSDFTAPGPNLTLDAGEESPGPIAMQPDGKALLVIDNGSPAKLIRIELPSFTRAGTGALSTRLGGAVLILLVDHDGSHAFAGVLSSPGRIVSMEPVPKPLRLGLYYDQGSSMALLWQSLPMAVTQASEWVQVPVGQGAPSTLKLQPGPYMLGWQFDADEAGPSHQFGQEGDGVQLPMTYGGFPGVIARYNQATSWTTTVSRWSAHLEFTNRNSAAEWQHLE